ncbi:ornithine--oxo-acid transaminase [Candidatus Uabimicrobium amorphum]|uniref:ornithine aminotransferase n=1 Tax=Uabimicrobium amorphum TaxID=2596890 RepID=A0A5S9IU73_UABAM|nr:ornithine--oxo-acid transaminase [Candidatus Uabimicrobium amorphum]BBM87651.1 ornithine aminotransferase [Candidatus Uabimicrobium amorphum]
MNQQLNSSTPKLNNQQFVDLENKYAARNYHPLDVVLEKGEGIWVYDVEGNKYLDCLSAYSAVNQGHCHPRLVKTAKEQIEKLTLTSRAFRNNQLSLFCKEICELTKYEMVLPMNSGAEAVETAIKAARKWGYTKKGIPENEAEIIVFTGNFHGRTTTIISFSSEEDYKTHFGPFTPGFTLAEYGNIEAAKQAITDKTAAILIEPIQGEAGIIMPPQGYLEDLYNLCKENNILFMSDEIQTGLGRTGRLFASDYENIKPDVTIVGKALSGGFYPVSAMLSNAEILGVFQPGQHGSTFGGNPLGMAVARESLKILVEENLIGNAYENGKYFREKLVAMNSRFVKEVRGRGLLIGVELNEEAKSARPFCEKLQQLGILCKETHYNIIRFAPPLIITKEDIDAAMEKIAKVLA